MDKKVPTIPALEFVDSIHRWQQGILKSFDDRLARFFMLCWHRRARKTTLGLNLLIKEACQHPNRVYAYIGPTYKQAKAIIWRDPNMLFKYLSPELIVKRNESELIIELFNRSIIAIRGADNPDSIRGADYFGVFIDEWALMKSMVWEEILRPIITQDPARWAVFAFTPRGRNFVYDYWLKADRWTEWYKSFLPVSQSELLPAGELLKAKNEMPPELYEQEFECSFLADEKNVLIAAKALEDLRGVHRTHKEIRRVVSCDPSQGGDECIIYVLENGFVKEMKVLHVKDPMLVAGEIAAMMFKHNTIYAAVDAIGIGAGICGRLQELGKTCLWIQSAHAAEEPERFSNCRTEMWWYLAQEVLQKRLPYPEDPELRRELSFVKCHVVASNGKVALEVKKLTSDRLGRSPDRADAFVYGIWALRTVLPVKAKDAWADQDDHVAVSQGAQSAMAA